MYGRYPVMVIVEVVKKYKGVVCITIKSGKYAQWTVDCKLFS